MAVKTYSEQLEEVQNAITAILTGAQSYTFSGPGAGRTVTRANLGDLQKREEWLRAKVDVEDRGGIRIRGVTPV